MILGFRVRIEAKDKYGVTVTCSFTNRGAQIDTVRVRFILLKLWFEGFVSLEIRGRGVNGSVGSKTQFF